MKELLNKYIQMPFILTAVSLILGASFLTIGKNVLNLKPVKKELPLKAPFDEMNETALLPYRVVQKQKIDNKDVIESLGTENYMQWVLEDPQAEPGSPVRYCMLFITYYTGNPDQVPHVPEECYTGGGSDVTETTDLMMTLNMPDPNSAAKTKEVRIPARCLMLQRKSADILQNSTSFPIVYFFKVNGVYRGNRNTTRLALANNFTSEYSYFSKVELKFFNSTASPTKQQAVEASEKLLAVVLPELEARHWPEWK